jgi:LysM repeat protein
MVTRISGWTVWLVLVVILAAAGCNRGGDGDQPAAGPSSRATTTAGSPSPSPSPSPAGETYIVESGDTLSEIAQRFDTTVRAIVAANDLDDPDKLGIGDELIIPPEERPRSRPTRSES